MSTKFARRAVAALSAPVLVGSVLFAAPATAYDRTDTDGDGTADVFENLVGTNPNDANSYAIDVDKDGYPDFYELDNGSNPDDPKSLPPDPVAKAPAADTDTGTGGERADTDGDGLFDDDEKNVYRTNPTVADTDGDGGSDGAEVYESTDPLKADDQTREDGDDDGLFDVDETQQYGTDPANPDTDSDGVGDGAERENGTSPTNPGDS
jgi:large repetitive protein